MSKNPYEILGVAKNATDSEIKKAYHKLVMKYHPDKNQGDKQSEEKFKEVNNAFDILKDPQKRAAYDQFGDSAFAGGNGASSGFGGNPFGGGAGFGGFAGGGMEDILREAMKGFGFGGFGGDAGQRSAARPGRDLLDEVVISMSDAYFGKTHTVKFSSNVKCDKCNGHGTADGKEAPTCATCHGAGVVRQQKGFFTMDVPCSECDGLGKKINKKCSKCDASGVMHKQRTLEVEIPRGVHDGTRLRLNGQGEAGMYGAPSGNFYLDIRVKPDNQFARYGDDLLIKENVDFTTLALGGEIEVETIDGKKLNMKIPSGTQINDKLRVKDHGMPKAGRSNSFGDMYVEIQMTVPTKLNDKQKKALTEFANTKSDKKGWF